MNDKYYFFVRCSGVFRPIIDKMHIDYDMYARLLNTKLYIQKKKEKQRWKSIGKASSFQAFWNLIMGVFLAMILWPPSIYRMEIFYMLMLIFLFIVRALPDYGPLFLDTTDAEILQPKGISKKLIGMVKLSALINQLGSIILAYTIPAALVIAYLYDSVIAGLIQGLMVMMACLLGIILMGIVYTILLHIFERKHIQKIMSNLTLLVNIIVVVGGQFLAQGILKVGGQGDLEGGIWQVLLIPAWFAAPTVGFIRGYGDYWMNVASLLGICLPLLLLTIYIKYMIPILEQDINKEQTHEVETKTQTQTKESSLKTYIIKLWSKNRQEEAIIDFACRILRKEDKTKLRILPNVILALVFPLILIVVNSHGPILDYLHQEANLIYFIWTVFFVSALYFNLYVSQNPQASWIFRRLDFPKAFFMDGAVKAFWITYFLPMYMGMLFILVFIKKEQGIFECFYIIGIHMFTQSLLLLRMKEIYPFSESYSPKELRGDNTLNLLITCVILSPFVILSLFCKANILASTLIDIMTLFLGLISWKLSYHYRIKKNRKRKRILLKNL